MTSAPAWAGNSVRPQIRDGVVVDGQVQFPALYTEAQLANLPQTTIHTSNGDVTGVAARDLVLASQPNLPAVKNSQLRVVITVYGAHHTAASFALGEWDPDFGNHPALLVPGYEGETLVVPNDRDGLRTIRGVRDLRVRVTDPGAASARRGYVVVRTGGTRVVLTPADIAALPQHLISVTFLAGTTSETHTEYGPTLSDVLRAAGVEPVLTTSATAVGADGYAAAVTPGEAWVGTRRLLISTAEDGVDLDRPRLVADGDIKGGRYVSDLVALAVRS